MPTMFNLLEMDHYQLGEVKKLDLCDGFSDILKDEDDNKNTTIRMYVRDNSKIPQLIGIACSKLKV